MIARNCTIYPITPVRALKQKEDGSAAGGMHLNGQKGPRLCVARNLEE